MPCYDSQVMLLWEASAAFYTAHVILLLGHVGIVGTLHLGLKSLEVLAGALFLPLQTPYDSQLEA